MTYLCKYIDDDDDFRKLKQNCLTVGEMAKLYDMPKQNLIYYDNIDLLKPDYLAPNGYRLYSLMQFLTLDMVLSLRKMNIPIATIKDYLENRNPESFIELMETKQEECREIIRQNKLMIKCMERLKEELLRVPQLVYEKPLLEEQPERFIYITSIEKINNGKKRMMAFVEHNQNIPDNFLFSSKDTGFTVSPKKFFASPKDYSANAYFTWQAQNNAKCQLLPAGTYLTYNFHNIYFKRQNELAEILNRYLEEQGLEPAGDILITPLVNKWTAQNVDDYSNSLSFLVKAKK